MKKTALKVSALVLAAALVTGCANTAEIEATANKAAAAAQSTADQALSAATEAQACCEANRESMERMFQKSMSK